MSTDLQKSFKKRADTILARDRAQQRKWIQTIKAKHKKRRERGNSIDRAIKIFLHMGLSEVLTESHLRDAEQRLGLPLIRLRLYRDAPFSSFDGRQSRIYETLMRKYPTLTRRF